jgi:hypothetical protein
MKVRSLKPQDIVVALKLARRQGDWKYAALAAELEMSASEVHGAVQRLTAGQLFNPVLKRVDRLALRKLIVHGLPHVFPAVPAERTRGLPTAISAKPLADMIQAGDEAQMVWPSQKLGSIWGRRVEPLYRSAPEAASRDPALHELLALVDAIRVGRARERNIASEILEQRLQ